MTDIDYKLRDEIIFGDYAPQEYTGGIRRIKILKLEQVDELLENKFIDLNYCYNDSPQLKVLYNFVKNHPDTRFNFIGFVDSPERVPSEVVITGLESVGQYSVRTQEHFRDTFSELNPDEFAYEDSADLYAWWD